MWAVEESRALAVAVDNLPYDEVPGALDAIGIEGAKPDPSIEALPDNVRAVIPPDPEAESGPTDVRPTLTASGGDATRTVPVGGHTFAAPSQARAPKGVPIGGEWIETPGAVLDMVREQGGASIDPLSGLQPTDGYMVAVQGFNEEVPEGEFFGPGGADRLVAWIDKNQEQLSQPGGHIGLWHDTANGEVVLDVSQRVDTLDEAVKLGGERNQQAIWDVANGEEISTGGTGDRQASAYRMEDYGRDTGPTPPRRPSPGLGGVGRGAQARLRAGDDRRARPAGLTFSPDQARAPKGTVIGGEWIQTPGGLLAGISYTGPLTLPPDVELDPILVQLGWTMDPVTREVIQPPKVEEPGANEVLHFDPVSAYGSPGAPSSYEQLAGELAETNPSYNDPTGGGKMNCQRTSAAFEMQARGYDVVAPPAPGIDGKAQNIEGMWQTPEGRTPMFTLLPRPTTQDAIQSTDFAPGYRFIVIGHNSDLGSGHAWNAEVMEDGSIFQWDPQSGDEMHPSFWGLDKINVLRVDNLEPTSTIAYDGGRRMPPWVMSRQEYDWAYPESSRY